MKPYRIIDEWYIWQNKDPSRPDEHQGEDIRIRCPECQGPASFNCRKLVGRCFICDLTLWFRYTAPGTDLDALFRRPPTGPSLHHAPAATEAEAGPVPHRS